MPQPLTEAQDAEVERIMSLAMDWLMTWDVVGEGADIAPEKERTAARNRLKDAVVGVVYKPSTRPTID